MTKIDQGFNSSFYQFYGLEIYINRSQKPKKSNDVRFTALRCILFELWVCENSAEFSAESGCQANDLTQYTACRVLPYIYKK